MRSFLTRQFAKFVLSALALGLFVAESFVLRPIPSSRVPAGRKDDDDKERVVKEWASLPEDDRIPWDFEEPMDRIVAIGDVHGDYDALAKDLVDRRVIDGRGNWIAHRTHLVIAGDLIGKGDHSRLVLDLVMQLEQKAKAMGSLVHAIPGNMEAKASRGDLQSMTSRDARLFNRYPVAGSDPERIFEGAAGLEAFKGDSVYAQWWAHRNAIVRLRVNTDEGVKTLLFLHGDLGPWAKKFSPGMINRTIRAFFKYWAEIGDDFRDYVSSHDAAEELRARCGWVVGLKSKKYGIPRNQGPLFGKGLKPEYDDAEEEFVTREGAFTAEEFDRLLDRNPKWKSDYLVVGHVPTESGKIEKHPVHDRVFRIDTGISEAVEDGEGRISALVIGGRLSDPIARYSRRLENPHSLRTRAMMRLRGSCNDAAAKLLR